MLRDNKLSSAICVPFGENALTVVNIKKTLIIPALRIKEADTQNSLIINRRCVDIQTDSMHNMPGIYVFIKFMSSKGFT